MSAIKFKRDSQTIVEVKAKAENVEVDALGVTATNASDAFTEIAYRIRDVDTDLTTHNHDALYEPKNSNIQTHISSTTNPHGVTKAQVGLGNVENKSAATILGELTSTIIVNKLGFTPMNATLKGAASGVAELDSSGKVPASQLPSYVDDVIEAANLSSFPATGESGKIYVAIDTNKTYRWTGSAYVEISASLALGETSSTAYRGDRGKVAYDHSQTAHAPSNAQANQNAFSSIVVGDVTVAADNPTDAVALIAGTGITLTADAANDTITITGVNQYVHPATHSADMIVDGTTNKAYTATEKTKLSGIATGAEVNQNAFSSIKIGTSYIDADSKTDTLELIAGTGISISPNVSGDAVTIARIDQISDANAVDLTDGGDTTLHYHATDRNRANHTGTQTASTISDFPNSVRGTVLTGLSTSTKTAVAATDTALVGIGKLQGQVTDLYSIKIDKTAIDDSVVGTNLWTSNKIKSELQSGSTSSVVQYNGTITTNPTTINMTVPSLDNFKSSSVEVLIQRGTRWDRALHGVDYVYGFTSATNLQVDFFTLGTYKVNYGFTSTGSMVFTEVSATQPLTQTTGDLWYKIL